MNVRRSYRQTARADAAEQRTDRIRRAALELFVEVPFEQLTLSAVADRAGVGLQTLIRRVGTKDGLVAMVTDWVGPLAGELLGPPESADPEVVACAFARQYEQWAPVNERTYQQRDASPALAANAEAGRRAHRDWVARSFAVPLAGLPHQQRAVVLARLVAVTGVELWLVLRRDEKLTEAETTDAVRDLIHACLPPSASGSTSTDTEKP